MRWRGTTMQNFIIFKKLNMMKLFKISLLWSTCQEISDFQNLAPPISFYTPAWGLRLVCNSIIPSIIVNTSTPVYVPLSDTLEPIPRDIQIICIFMRAEAFLKCYPCHITCRQFSLNRSQLLTEDGVVIFYNVIGVFAIISRLFAYNGRHFTP